MLCLPPGAFAGGFFRTAAGRRAFLGAQKKRLPQAAPFCFMLWFSDSTLENKPVTRIA